METVQKVHFEKKCEHGQPMKVVRKLSGAWWYEAVNCPQCKAEEQAKQDVSDKEFEIFIERLKARQKK